MISTRLRQHRERRRGFSTQMALVPFIDMMIILVVFLLLHTSDVDILPNTRNVPLPQSTSQLQPRQAVVVTVTSDSVWVAGEQVGSLAELAAAGEDIITPLQSVLLELRAAGGAEESVRPAEVTIMGDRSVPYSVLKKIMATCTSADFSKVSLAVLERARQQPGGVI